MTWTVEKAGSQVSEAMTILMTAGQYVSLRTKGQAPNIGGGARVKVGKDLAIRRNHISPLF